MKRITANGNHLAVDERPFRVRGATYGTFVPRLDAAPYPERWRLKQDLRAMAEAGLNTVRTYDVPPDDFIEIAEELGLRIIVGLHYFDWRSEAHTGRLAQKRVLEAGRRAVSYAMHRFAGRASILAIAVGNEVPADLVRMHGPRRVEDTLSALIDDVHAADPAMFATYVNFPTTEYLHVRDQDLACFNVFLERRESFGAYLRHLQIVTENLPLVITELGLAAEVHGQDRQAEALDWQLRLVDECGCAGATVFSWTDDWAVAGEEVNGWGFGITDAARRGKPALDVVSGWARSTMRDLRAEWPRVSAVVCVYNGARWIERCIQSLAACDYPDLEIIVCDDGSTDQTREIVRRFACRLFELPHVGLAEARNAGIRAATGEIVAFLDADAFCHPEWPFNLAMSLEEERVAGTGGPNLPVPGLGFVERAVAQSPGTPVEVLLSDDRAEHVPGCNMAFRRQVLEEVGGFDPIYTVAGDDVDVCWKVTELGRDIGFAPAAQVLHHRRDTVRGYLRQQGGYGRAERLLAGRHPRRFDRVRQARWKGAIYVSVGLLPTLFRPIVYHGRLGQSPFQPVVSRRPQEAIARISGLIPFIFAGTCLGMGAAVLSPWGVAGASLGFALLLAYATAIALSVRPGRYESHPIALRLLVAFFHVAQPLVRAQARLIGPKPPMGAPASGWDGERSSWLDRLQGDLNTRFCRVRAGNEYQGWDLEVTIASLTRCVIRTALLWVWTPVYRVSFRLGPAAILGIIVALGLVGVDASLGVKVLATVVVATLLEGLLLRLLVRRSVKSTTEESGA